MEYTQISSEMFDSQLKSLIDSMIWKNRKIADALDVNTDAIIVDKYLAAARKLLTKYTMTYLTEIPDMTTKEMEAVIKGMPIEYKNAFRIIHDYQEFNDYYRMLNGLPDLDDTEYFYIQNEPKIDPTIPIHELPINDRYRAEGKGYIDELIKTHPGKKYRYLKHLTKRNIKPFQARLAERFEIIYLGTTEIPRLAEDFREVYEECLFYIMHVFYSPMERKRSDFYEEFVGLCILFMTIQQMHSRYLDADITRDFYDIDSVKILYESYSVPFYPQIPTEYHLKIVKNINRLISYKGSHRVFYELSDLFDFRDMIIFQYYFVKEHRVDKNKNPIFSYNLDGTINQKQTFDVKFAKVDIKKDPYIQIIDRNNHVDYEKVILPDQFWIDDYEVQNVLYNNGYNYKESKYIGAQLMFSMTAFLFESCYFMKMLSDNKESTQALYVYHDYMGKRIPLFDLTIYLIAAICKKNDFVGNIPSNIEQVARVFGFNFKDDMEVFRTHIIENPYLDIELLKFIRNIDINNLEDIHKVYSNIKDLHYYIEYKMEQCKDPHEYQAYSNLRRAILTTEQIPEIYKKNDGTLASSFMDLLEDLNYPLYLRLNSDEINLKTEINHCLVILKKLSSELKYIEYIDGLDVDVIVEFLYRMMRFFKSAKSELVDFNVVYVLDSRMWNMIKILDYRWWTYIKMLGPHDRFDVLLDEIFDSNIYFEFRNRPGQTIDFIDMIVDALFTFFVDEKFDLKDKMEHEKRSIYGELEEIRMIDDIDIHSKIYGEDKKSVFGLKDLLYIDQWINTETGEVIFPIKPDREPDTEEPEPAPPDPPVDPDQPTPPKPPEPPVVDPEEIDENLVRLYAVDGRLEVYSIDDEYKEFTGIYYDKKKRPTPSDSSEEIENNN